MKKLEQLMSLLEIGGTAVLKVPNQAYVDLWKEELLGQISDGAYENRSRPRWEEFSEMKVEVDPKLSRPVLFDGGFKPLKGFFPFHKDLEEVEDVWDRDVEIVKKTIPTADRALVHKMYFHLFNACRFPKDPSKAESLNESLFSVTMGKTYAMIEKGKNFGLCTGDLEGVYACRSKSGKWFSQGGEESSPAAEVSVEELKAEVKKALDDAEEFGNEEWINLSSFSSCGMDQNNSSAYQMAKDAG